MKPAKTAFLLIMAFSAARSFASAGKEIIVGVKGMVCGFCAQGIQKKFSVQPSVDKVDVSLNDKQVKLTLKDGKDIGDDTIKQILSESGYNVEKIDRK